jgi:glyoxylase-like metal-dependent hydrolase (beta-lactamase superfamily II)
MGAIAASITECRGEGRAMLRQVAEDVLVHESEFMQTNAVVVQGEAGVLLIDPGVQDFELTCLAGDLGALGQAVVAGFSTHPHWDHLLWHTGFGAAPRYGTARGAAVIGARLSDPDWRSSVVGLLPPDIIDHIPLDDLFGRITGMPAEATRVPWDGPGIRIVEHQGHAPGHAALLIEESGVLVAGDMLSDMLIPILNLFAPDPIEDYLAALLLLEGLADDIEVLIPGHGSVGGPDEVLARIEQDRAYVCGLRDSAVLDDPRTGPSARFGTEMTGVHERQFQRLAEGSDSDGTP